MSGSRYRQPPMSIDQYVAALERRVAALERLPRAGATAVDKANFEIKQGCLKIFDAAGVLVVEVGLTQDGRTGVRVNDSAGVEVAMISQLGIEAQNGSGSIVPLNVP